MNAIIHPRHSFNVLHGGDPAPWFRQKTLSGDLSDFDLAAGRYQLLCFFGSSLMPIGQNALKALAKHRAIFDDVRLSFSGVTIDPSCATSGRIKMQGPGIRFYIDADGSVTRKYGALPIDTSQQTGLPYRGLWVIVDPTLRIVEVMPFEESGENHEYLFRYLRILPAPAMHAGIPVHAPILVLPQVFPLEFCQRMIALHDAAGETDANAKITGQRPNSLINDASIIAEAQKYVLQRIVPEIRKAFQFKVTHMEHYQIECSSVIAGENTHPKRNNSTSGTAHRRFAVSINLNHDFTGGEIGFPEYGPRTFKAQAGGAIVYSCSFLQEVTPISRGRRYAFQPFLHDGAAVPVRKAP